MPRTCCHATCSPGPLIAANEPKFLPHVVTRVIAFCRGEDYFDRCRCDDPPMR